MRISKLTLINWKNFKKIESKVPDTTSFYKSLFMNNGIPKEPQIAMSVYEKQLTG